jgi:hypothetical protein
LTVVREVALDGTAGVLWGYLYWRHGLGASIAGHLSAHLSLQPLLSLFFARSNPQDAVLRHWALW